MISKFYDNIFASSYQLYSRYYHSSRATFRSVIIVALHIEGLLLLIIEAAIRIFQLDFSNFNNETIIITLGIFTLLIIRLTRLYPQEKTDILMMKFRSYTRKLKMAWGIITITTLLLEYIAIAFLLSK
jgi:hypothetical protein